MVRDDSAGFVGANGTPQAVGNDLRALIELLPVAVCTCDAPSGKITFFNEHAVRLWGRKPCVGDDIERFSGAFKLFSPDGEPLPRNQSPMATALRDGAPCRHREVMFERPDGTRLSVLVNVDPVRDESGRVVGAINAFHEITSLKQAEQAAAHLAAIIDNSDDAIVSKDLNGFVQSWNKGAERIFGYSAEEIVGKHITIVIPPERRDEESEILARLRRGERFDHFETVRVRKDGTPVEVSLSISPVKDSHGHVIGASKIARDITERKRMERLLIELQQRYAISLEEKVKRTSEELAQSLERLRLTERMASLGTLSAGLGHDMGNVLMPLRTHVEALAAHIPTGNGSQEHLESIRKSMDYLHTLAGGLRMLAIEPSIQQGMSQQIQLHEWWRKAQPILKTALGRKLALEHDIADDLPPVCIPMHMLTQAVFNLVQNAAHAMAAANLNGNGKVRITASCAGTEVLLTVSDNGPGMTEEVRRRCVEPYFTTKSRGISTGLGLTLVHGIVQAAKGSLEIESELGRGSTFTLRIPVASKAHCRITATMQIKNQRQAALTTHLIESFNFRTSDRVDDAQVFITDDPAVAEQFVNNNAGGRAIVFADSFTNAAKSDRLTLLPPSAKTADIRSALTAAIGGNE